ncbi:hypothetical protein BS627_03620 [Agrobacterium salinitolerans]|uniref:hypothetical protein n=1 Tax=Agrobacterium salinitolerans TaxID=1183413 RepID=UPI00098F19C7|nr:hypothetical protein [Agrobacterium salinitolerans]OOO27809.1 hypothetical protein BS627_03620 [Agrobacterium salinitolerans]PNQ25712.1 hypothetical protein C2E26_03675 [Rhizobium sp. YIC5082]
MSRYKITATRTASHYADPDAIIGYDRPLQTFFLRAFPDDEGEDLELWLGTNVREFETLSLLRTAAIARGFDFIPLASGILHKLLDDHGREAHHAVSDTIIQDLINGTPAR